MADTGAISPGTVVDDDTIGTITWSNPDNAKASDNSYATSNPSSGVITHYLKATNFGFSIPAGATIDGILVEIERYPQYPISIGDNEVKIVKSDGTIGTQNKQTGGWSTEEVYYSYGNSSDLWGETWTASDINDIDFGVVISVTNVAVPSVIAYIDHFRATVYYTEAVGTNMKINISDVWKDIESLKINIGDAWKDVIKIQQNIGDVWKDVFG